MARAKVPLATRSHFITFTSSHVDDVRVLKGDGAPKITDGYATWEQVDRPRRRSLTIWRGSAPLRMEVPVMFEGWHGNEGQEHDISKISRMASMQGQDEPPVVKVHGYGIPIAGPHHWVIEGIDWGDKVIWGHNNKGDLVRLRQDATIKLLQFVADDRTKFSKLAADKPGGGLWPKHYIVKRGDKLQKIAARFYHDHTKWKLIARANNIKDPKHLQKGRVLIIPRPGKKHKGKKK